MTSPDTPADKSSDRITIVFVLCTLKFGGAESIVFDVARSLDPSRFKPEVLCIIDGGQMVKVYEDAGIPVTVIKKRGKLDLIGAIWRYRRFFKQRKPDIVHSNLFGADLCAGIAASLAGVPTLISTEHGMNVDEGAAKRTIKRLLYNHIFHRVIAVSAAVRDNLADLYKVTPGKISIIFNGIDFTRFPKRTSDLLESHPVKLCVVGRLSPEKGQDLLIDALPNLNFPFELTIIGEGPTRAELEALTSARGMTSHVTFMGYRRDIPEHLKEIDILIQPSRWEALGIALIEGMRTGCLAVATRIPGIMDVVSDGVDGLLFEPENPTDLANVLNRAVADRERSRQLAVRGTETVEQKFELTAVVQQYESCYRELSHGKSFGRNSDLTPGKANC